MIGNVTKTLVVLTVTGLYSGFFPIAPGTMGTIAALITLYGSCAVFSLQPSQGELFQLAVWTFIVGIITVSRYLQTHPLKNSEKECGSQSQGLEPKPSNEATASQTHKPHLDPKEVVIDEWAGIFTALTFLNHPTILSTLVIFGLFRFFDASKVGPVGWFERLPGALGIMADDIVAGAFAGIAFRIMVDPFLS
jgi:phosphatidylglycerophosphatase A